MIELIIDNNNSDKLYDKLFLKIDRLSIFKNDSDDEWSDKDGYHIIFENLDNEIIDWIEKTSGINLK